MVLLSREQVLTVDDWPTATLADLIRASRVGRDGEAKVDEPIARLPAYVQALAEAQADPLPDPQPDAPTATVRPGY